MTEIPPIYIPTYKRVNRQVTAKWIPKSVGVFLVARPEEAKALRNRGHVVLECPAKGIGPTRQWIIENHNRDLWGDRLIMMDDDLRFYKRREDDPTKFWQLGKDEPNTDEMLHMLESLTDLLNEVPLASISNRSGANRDTTPVRRNVRMHDMFAIDLGATEKHKFRIDRIKFMEDFDFILQFLTAGYDTLCLNSYCKGDYGSNAPGGCSEYRDQKGQEAAARQLAEMWPAFVKLRQVKAKGEGMWGERTDVTVQWAKAASAGKLI